MIFWEPKINNRHICIGWRHLVEQSSLINVRQAESLGQFKDVIDRLL